MADITRLSAINLARKIRKKELSPVEVVDAYLARIEKVNPKVNAIVTLTAEDARARAKQAEQDVMEGKPLPSLHGVPCTVKDPFQTAGVRTTNGSKLFADYIPASDATMVKRLRAAGCIMLGKTNTPEFMMSQFTDNILFGPTRNPYKPERSVGGSSGGEAAALAARMSPLGIGSDIGGSLRIPAHCCGITSIRPTQGRCPQTGHYALGPAHYGNMNVVGPLGRSVRDVALLLSLLEGPDAEDPFCQPLVPTNPRIRPASGLRVGVFDLSAFNPVAQEVKDAVRKAADILAAGGGCVESAEDPVFGEIFNTWFTLMGRGIKEIGGMIDIHHVIENRDQLDPRFALLLELPSPDPQAALQADLNRAIITMTFFQLYEKFDVLVHPVLPTTAPEGDRGPVVDGQEQQLVYAALNCYASVLTGNPAAIVPVANGADGLPIGVEIMAKRGNDTLVLSAALAVEKAVKIKRPRG
jgi:Asp-tRNA(Asn)/Glu-tRNA(Gln) amidotransferase A subunit family amidase